MPEGRDRSLVQQPEQTALEVLQLVEQLCLELQPGSTIDATIRVDSQFDRDLGLDSLVLAELVQRAESRFGVALPAETMAEIQTPQDLIERLLQAGSETHIDSATETYCDQSIRAIELQRVESAPSQAQTLQQVMRWHLEIHPQRPHLYVYESADRINQISYQTLHRRASQIAVGLIRYDIEPGQSVAIMLPTCCDYFYVFFGILLARAIPVPIYPPARPSQIEDHLSRHGKILNNAQARLLVTVELAKPLSRLLQMQVPSLRKILLPAELAQLQAVIEVGIPQPQDIAFLQYTSGSTGIPKGVTLTHGNLLANIRAMGQAVKADSRDVFVSWLPVYHDMGLIGAWFSSLYFAIPLVIMSPLLFLSKPQRWLWAIHRHRGTLSPAPNFAYELCLNKIDEAELAGLDLSSWRLAWNGAEPVSASTLERFNRRFSRYGFRPETMAPVYGLAESTVGLTFPPLGRTPVIDRIQREPMVLYGRALPVKDSATHEPEIIRNIALGHPLTGHQLRIIDDRGRELPDRRRLRHEYI